MASTSSTLLTAHSSHASKSANRRRSLQIDQHTENFENELKGEDIFYKVRNQSTSELPTLDGEKLNPLQRKNSRFRPRSVNELRKSALFLDSDGNADRRLSLMFVDPEKFQSKRRSTYSMHSLSESQTNLSFSLSGNDDLLNVYRENAKKTNDPRVQLEFGKFLLESSVNLLNKDLPTYDEESSQKLEKEGIFWIKKLQKLNNPEAVYIVGTWNEKGMYGYSPSSSRSNTLYLSSAKLGYPPAIDKVGFHYEKKKDYTRAVAYYKKAAALADPSANYRLGIAYIYGELKLGVNHKNAQFYLRRSASEANQYCPQGAYIWALILFGLYEEDLGIRDDVEGRDYLIKAADLNYLPAQYKLGYCYEYGEYNLQVDPMLSIDYYRRAAQGGHPEAQVALSGWYLTGAPGVLDQSDELAFQWCSKASSQGFPKAEYAMGQYYEMGVGVEISLQNALGWYKKAAGNGFEKAKERLNQPDFAPTLTRSDIGTIRQKGRKKDKKKNDCVIC